MEYPIGCFNGDGMLCSCDFDGRQKIFGPLILENGCCDVFEKGVSLDDLKESFEMIVA